MFPGKYEDGMPFRVVEYDPRTVRKVPSRGREKKRVRRFAVQEVDGFDFVIMELDRCRGTLRVCVITPVTAEGPPAEAGGRGRVWHVIPLQAFRGRPVPPEEEEGEE